MFIIENRAIVVILSFQSRYWVSLSFKWKWTDVWFDSPDFTYIPFWYVTITERLLI